MMNKISSILPGVLFISVLSAGVALAQPDIPEKPNAPLISPPLRGYSSVDVEIDPFDAFLPALPGGRDVQWTGKVSSYRYSWEKDGRPFSTQQIVRKYEAEIKRAGGKILGSDKRRMAAEIRKNSLLTGIYVEAFNDGMNYNLTIVEPQAMRQEGVAEADAMRNDLDETGKTIVHGIYFDDGSAEIKPESEPALAEIVKLFQGFHDLKVYVVGHTDNAGSLKSNLKLSSDRAASVVKAVTARGVKASRLKPAGVGPYSPAASNDTDEGRAKNRRVELVKQ